MKRKEYQDIIEVLEIKLKHLQNDFLLTKEESETTSMKYLEIMLELKEKNQQLVDLQKNLEQMVDQRTEQLEEAQKVLQQKSEELQIMVDSSPSMIFIKDISDLIGQNEKLPQLRFIFEPCHISPNIGASIFL